MEKEKMEIKDLIKTYTILLPEQVSCFLRTFKDFTFETANIIHKNQEGIVNKSVRNVDEYELKIGETITEDHWYNLICYKLRNTVQQYIKENNINLELKRITNVTLLKYEKGGFYKTHIDHNLNKAPRNLSCVIFLNNDYEGGNLKFYTLDFKEVILEVKPEVGKLVIFPSYFMYPHKAETVKKGIRYTIVSWIR
jgi:predicted 2-oxoglutarate/Fe(II)-dependent dioxygenase YbiX|tara:strand:- start:538 stop:1122 length:585 start_codon:yes stop_codon:yes gene_type:complete